MFPHSRTVRSCLLKNLLDEKVNFFLFVHLVQKNNGQKNDGNHEENVEIDIFSRLHSKTCINLRHELFSSLLGQQQRASRTRTLAASLAFCYLHMIRFVSREFVQYSRR